MVGTDAPLCFYCRQPVDPVSDCWIGHGTMAHYQCAWGVDEAFWAKQGAGEGGVAEDAARAQ
jgi:hypothetical protein